MGSKEIIQLVLILVPFACFMSAGRAQSRIAYWIFRVGGLIFAMAMAMAVLSDNLCGGSLSDGITTCAAGLTPIFRLLGPIILTLVTTMLSVGPILLVVAFVVEAIHRYRTR